MANTKTYENSVRKRQVRDRVIPRNKFKTLVTLGGPSIVEFYEQAAKKGFVNIISYENDPATFALQQAKLALMEAPNLKIMLADVYNQKIEEDTFYDLDFCGNIFKYEEYLEKFRENCSFTFTLRTGKKDFKKEDVIDFFFAVREESYTLKKISETSYEALTSAGEYVINTYKDGAPMINFTKTK